MNNENNKDKEQNIKKEIIDYYLNAKDKKKAIDDLCKMYEFSRQWIYQILKENNIPTPSKFKNDLDSDNIKKPETILQSFDDLEIYSDSLIQKYKDHGFYDKDEAQRNMNIQMYAEAITGIDVWNNYFVYLRQLIYDIESDQLRSDIKEIKTGHFRKSKTVDNIIDQMVISSAEEIRDTLNPKVAEPSEPKPEPQKDMWGEMLRFTDPKMYMVYKLMTDPKVKEGYINALNQYQQLVKSKNLNPKNKNLEQKIKFNDIFPNEKKVKNIKPKEISKELNLTPQELKEIIKSTMPEPLPKRAHNRKKRD